ncbi:MAG: arginyltransferase [Acidobacteria bacterium]|nr:arginyltransferase [Acidobacteriota bacterium]
MARLVEGYRESPHPCPYLPDRLASLDVRLMVDVTPAELSELLAHGWRRFGPTYFRPACPSCTACLSTRIVAPPFAPTRSQKRARRNAARLTRSVTVPRVDDERLALYERWHHQRESQRGWSENPLDAERYAFDFAFPHPSVREVTFRDPANGNRLVGVGLVDCVPDALSAIYFFWDPDDAPSSLGVAHIVMLVEDALSLGLSYVYLGYRVDACPSLAYKARYQPQEILTYPGHEARRPVWRIEQRPATERLTT